MLIWRECSRYVIVLQLHVYNLQFTITIVNRSPWKFWHVLANYQSTHVKHRTNLVVQSSLYKWHVFLEWNFFTLNLSNQLSLSRSRSYQNLFIFIFQLLMLSLSACNTWKKCIYIEIAKLKSKKMEKFYNSKVKKVW